MCVPSIATTVCGNPQHVSKFVMTSHRRSLVGKHTYRGKRCVAIVLQVEMTMVQTVKRPMLNNSDRVRYSMFVANVQIVRVTRACTLMGCLILVSCLSIRGWSSLHSIIKVSRDNAGFPSTMSLGISTLHLFPPNNTAWPAPHRSFRRCI